MPGFDVQGARKAGYTDAQIAEYLAQSAKFDTAAARKAGYTDADIIAHLAPRAQKPVKSWGEVGAEAVQNAPQSAAQFAKGLIGAVTHPAETASNIWYTATGAAKEAARAALPTKAFKWLESFEKDPAAIQRATTAARAAGEHYRQYTTMEGVKNAIAKDPVSVAADMSMLLGGAGGVARGASKTVARVAPRAANVMARTANVLERGGQAVNPVNVMAKPAGRLAQAAGKIPSVAVKYAKPKTAAYLEAAEGKAPEIIQALRAPDRVIVPGTKPSAAEVASSVKAAKFSALGEASKKVLPSENLLREEANVAARKAAVQTVGKTPADLAAAEAARSSTAASKYGAIERSVVAIDGTFRKLMQRPSMNKAMDRAAQLSKEQGVPFQIGRDIQPSNIAGLATSGSPAKYSVQSLHNIKIALDDILKDPATYGVGANEARVMGNTRRELINWIETKEPGYKSARETFAAQSKPINQMEVGQYLEGKLASVIDDTAPQRANVFAGAVNDAASTIKRATSGQARFKELTDVLTPDQAKVIYSIRDDLARESLTQRQAKAAATTSPNAARLASLGESAVRMPNLLNRVTAVANDIIGRLKGKIDRRLAIELATEMLDPQQAANALSAAVRTQKQAARAGAGIEAAARAAGRAASTPAGVAGAQIQNIMAQQPQQ